METRFSQISCEDLAEVSLAVEGLLLSVDVVVVAMVVVAMAVA